MNNLTSLRLGAPTSVEGTLGGLYEMEVQCASRLRSLTLKDGEQSRYEYDVSGVRVGIEDIMRDLVISQRCAFELSVSGVRSTSARAAAMPLEFSTVTATKVGGDGSVTQEGNHVTVEGYAVVRIRATHYGHEVYLRDLHCCVMAHPTIGPLCETYAPLQQVLVERNELVPLLAEYPDLVHSLVDTGTQQYVHQDGGSSAGYILTDLRVSADMEVYADVRPMQGATSGVIRVLGADNTDPYDMWMHFQKSSGNLQGYFKIGRTETNKVNAAWNNVRNMFVVTPQKWGVVGSETERVANVSGMDAFGDRSVSVFGRTTSSADRNTTANDNLDIFSLVVKQGGVTHLLVPFVRDGQTGFLDLATHHFFGNSHTSGEFSIGNDTADYGDHYRTAFAATDAHADRVTHVAPVSSIIAAAQLLGQAMQEDGYRDNSDGYTMEVDAAEYIQGLANGSAFHLRVKHDGVVQPSRNFLWTVEEVLSGDGVVRIDEDGLVTVSEGDSAVVRVKALLWKDSRIHAVMTHLWCGRNADILAASSIITQYPALVGMMSERPQLVSLLLEWPDLANSLVETGKRNVITQTTGSSAGYIKTGIVICNDMSFSIIAKPHIVGGESSLVGGGGSTTNNKMQLYFNLNSNKTRIYARYSGTKSEQTNEAWNDAWNEYRFDAYELAVGEQVLTHAADFGSLVEKPNCPIALFGNMANDNGTTFTRNTTANNTLSVQEFMIRRKEEVHRLVPFVHDGEAGVIDLYDLSFHGNAHTAGEFVITTEEYTF